MKLNDFVNKLKDNLTEEQVYRYIDVIIVVLLAVFEIILCTQYGVANIEKRLAPFILLIVFCLLLEISCVVSAFGIKHFKAKCVFYGLDFIFLLVLCLITGNSWLAALYCIFLSQVYVSADNFRSCVILFVLSCVAFVISFVCGWAFANPGADVYTAVVQVLSGCLTGLIVFALHFIILNFTLKFYRTNLRLIKALKEADESREQLAKAYEKLSETAVFEERNRIAKDIHDNAGHSMTTVIMQTEAAKLLIDSDPAEAKNRIISANIQAKNALEQMRESVHLLAGRGGGNSLKAEIEEIVAQTIDGTELKVRCDLDDLAAEPELQRFVCNSLKECLANGVRHGRATAFYVELKEEGEGIKLLVSDNGSGASGSVQEGFGLKSMRTKAEGLGGSAAIHSESGEGFEVEIKIPKNTGENI